MSRPPVDTAEGPAQEPGAASWDIRSLREPAGLVMACSLLLQRIILPAYTFHPRQDVLDALANLPPTGRRRTDVRTTGTQQVADQVFWLRNWHIAAYPLTICFYRGNQSDTLRSGELIGTMVFERAAPVGFAGRVAGREFSANSPPSGTATDSAAFQWAGNLRL
jgi:hypothetical protein